MDVIDARFETAQTLAAIAPMKFIALVFVLLALPACTTVRVARGSVSPQAAQCDPADQDAFVYSPDRLEVLSPCIRVSGVVRNIISNPFDGDLVMGLELDPPFEGYLTAANRASLGGTLHVEVICHGEPLIINPRARSACSQNPDPLRGPLPAVGAHVWMEGRWVLDHSHGGWAELHPLYRWSEY